VGREVVPEVFIQIAIGFDGEALPRQATRLHA
jgi:hypothetical protein